MKPQELDRINELAKKARTPEGLTSEEKEEQAKLRRAYVAAFRASLQSQLDHITVVEADGSRHKLTKKEDKMQ